MMPLRILVYAQHLSGVGHYVRTYEIARALASHHQVHWVEGGRPVPHAPCPRLRLVELPRIRRGPDGLIRGLDASQDTDSLMRLRAARLLEQVEAIRPRVFLIEYFPFSKWELSCELLPAIAAVRAQGGRVLCSLRDVVRKTRFETAPDLAYAQRVTELLNRHFDALLVHADPALTRLEEHFPAVADIRPPIHYTGLVSEKLSRAPATDTEIARLTDGRPFVLASAGGGAGGRHLITLAARTWRDPGVAAGRPLVICAGLGWSEQFLRELSQGSAPGRVLVLPFSGDFLHWLAAADLSISQCGYNTAANLLETGTPAIVCPNPNMSDQPFRAQRLAERGLVALLSPDGGVEDLARAIDHALSQPRGGHQVDLDGALHTCEWISEKEVLA